MNAREHGGRRRRRARRLILLISALALSEAVAMPELGTLLYTPEERAAVLARRRGSGAEEAAAGAGAVRLDGILERPEGSWAWLSGQRYADRQRVPQFGELRIGRGEARLNGRRLRPGERLDAVAVPSAAHGQEKEAR